MHHNQSSKNNRGPYWPSPYTRAIATAMKNHWYRSSHLKGCGKVHGYSDLNGRIDSFLSALLSIRHHDPKSNVIIHNWTLLSSMITELTRWPYERWSVGLGIPIYTMESFGGIPKVTSRTCEFDRHIRCPTITLWLTARTSCHQHDVIS